MPTPTDLVTDLPADFEVFGQAVDTSMADLKGGTSGQILSKATNADMDFTWITNDVGDITAVTVSSPLTGGGTSGSVSVGILNGTTSNLGAVQLSDSTSSTSTTLAATANAVKTTYDLAAAAVPKSTVTTAGDVIYATGSAAVTRLGIGTAGQVLTVNSGATAPQWSTPAALTFVGCILNNSVQPASVANATHTAVSFDNEVVDTNGFHSTVTNTSRITIPTGYGGKYYINGATYWATTGAGGVRGSRIYKNGANFVDFGNNNSGSGEYPSIFWNTIISLNAGDYIEFYVYQSSGGALGYYAMASEGANWAVQYLGA